MYYAYVIIYILYVTLKVCKMVSDAVNTFGREDLALLPCKYYIFSMFVVVFVFYSECSCE